VIITPHTVIIYRSEEGRFQQLQEISEGSKELTAVDIADINGNGYGEIFVTSLNANKNVLDSFVLEYDGKNYVKTINGSPWYYRVTNTPSRGRILLGQQPRMGKPYSGTIYEMIWQGNEYVPGEEIKTPRDTNLLGFAIGDVMNNDQEAAVAYKADDRMRVMDSSGSILWDGSELYGGSMLYYAGPDYGRDRNIVNKLYLPMRLLVWKDPSKKESVVIAAKNHDWSNMKLDYRKFTSSTIEAFTWDGIGLGPRWKTRKISGYISDISIGDFDNDGRDELVAAVVLKEGAVVLLTEPKSTIIAYELSMPEKPKS
jgi:hypothetical protein